MKRAKIQPALELTGDFHVEPGYRNPEGRVTNWKLIDRRGNCLATMTTQTGANRVAGILTRAAAIIEREKQNHATV